ncbi:FkbM family methyltransferase [Planotetraspora sp. A-T 1434]|uniref:FkbM family methyltransferase n=1 Tax=Planotetraspora sp. A-T 1434 TaxID=2979219 RepID=UPI0021C00B7B|nr:FkbM family methyltransferase [Planotetraspora sp. A-T 1434]MCT9929928.1 FkbM family methyltransferase [Planotetraspora sp. A-T 1434]
MTKGTGGDFDLPQVEGINPHETRYLYTDIFTQRSYLPAGTTLPQDAVVRDVGANIGMFALFVKAMCPAQVYAFEPMPPVLEALTRNLRRHEVAGGAYPHGLSDHDGETEFVFYPGYSIMSAQRAHASTDLDRAFVRELVVREHGGALGEDADLLNEMLAHHFREVPYPCPLRRLSTVIAELALPHVDLLEIDVQRSEIEVLDGIDDRHWPLIRHLAVEVHDEPGTATEGRLEIVLRALRERGYRAHVLPAADASAEGRRIVFAGA